jgi:RNA polymerase sigma-70 factor (ECF subfamily)
VLEALAMRLARNPAHAQDLVQDTLERGLRRAGGLPPDSNVRGWLIAVLHNLFIDDCRRRKRAPEAVPIDLDRDVPAPEPSSPPAWARISSEQLADAVAQLDAEFREVYRLHAVDGRSYDEIAEALGIPRATVGTRLYRARKKLKSMLLPQAQAAGGGE